MSCPPPGAPGPPPTVVCFSPVLETQTQLGADLEPRPTLILSPPTIHYDASNNMIQNIIIYTTMFSQDNIIQGSFIQNNYTQDNGVQDYITLGSLTIIHRTTLQSHQNLILIITLPTCHYDASDKVVQSYLLFKFSENVI